MVVNMSSTATQEQINHVMDRIKECGFLPHLIQGAERTVIGVVGKNRGRRSELEALRVAPGVEDIIPISQPFTLVSLELQTKRTVVDVKGCEIGIISSTPGATRRASSSLRRPRFLPTTPITVRSAPWIR